MSQQVTHDELIGAIVARRRYWKNVKQASVSVALGWSPGNLSKYEHGQYGFTFGDIVALSEHVDLSLSTTVRVHILASQLLEADKVAVVHRRSPDAAALMHRWRLFSYVDKAINEVTRAQESR